MMKGDGVYRILPKRMKLAFDLKECAAHVSQDVYGELEAHSSAYKRHKKALQALEFSDGALTERQAHNAAFFAYALGRLESVVCDGLWAAGVFAAISPEKPVSACLDKYARRLRQTGEFTAAMSEVEHSFYWMKLCMDVESHERLERYREEQLQRLRLVAMTTAWHGYEFGCQIVEMMGLQSAETTMDERDLSILTERQREVCIRKESGMETRQIAEELGITPNMVRQHLNHAERRFREFDREKRRKNKAPL